MEVDQERNERYRDKINHIKMLRKSNPAVNEYLNFIFERPIPNIRLYTQKFNGGVKVELKNNFNKSNKNALAEK